MKLRITPRQADRLANLACEIEASGGTCLRVAGDAADPLTAAEWLEFAGQGRTPESVAHFIMMDPEETAAAVLFACAQPPNLRITQMTVRHMGRQHKG